MQASKRVKEAIEAIIARLGVYSTPRLRRFLEVAYRLGRLHGARKEPPR